MAKLQKLNPPRCALCRAPLPPAARAIFRVAFEKWLAIHRLVAHDPYVASTEWQGELLQDEQVESVSKCIMMLQEASTQVRSYIYL